ncbi:MAG TPA: hypothetical protein VFT93_00970 [Candidatus Eisenbacteria bacterium]|nr:hypothetical protein [Candidatus Eisenbacteria bacterium]
MPRPCSRLLIAGVLLTMLASSAGAQSIWIPRDRDRSVTLAAAKPSLDYVDEKTFSPVLTLTSRQPLGTRMSWVVEIPYAHLSVSEQFFVPLTWKEGSAIGNPYLGLEAHAASGPLFAELGARVPLMDENEPGVANLGRGSDVRMLEAFDPNEVSIVPAINLRETTETHIAYRFRLSPTVTIPTQKGLDQNSPGTDLWMVYSWQIAYEGRVARVGSGLSGRLLLTEDFGNLGERTVNQLEFHADLGSGAFRPGLDVRVPLGLEAAYFPVVLGLTLSWSR